MEKFLQNDYLMSIVSAICYIAAAYVLFYCGKIFYSIFNPKIDAKSELVFKDNFAFAIAQTGYFAGLLAVIGGAIVGPSRGLLFDLLDILIYGLMAIFLLNISMKLNGVLILRKFNVRKELIEDQNPGTGVVEAASAFSSGLIIFGALAGESNNLTDGIISLLIFWAIGQIMFFITGLVYNLIIPYDVQKEIEKDNSAAGLGFAGALIAISILIYSSIHGAVDNISVKLVEVCIEVAIGLVMLPIARFFAAKVLLPGQKLSHEIAGQEKPNVGAGLIEAFAYIGSAVLISWCL
jgi:uncharacterized membrane protein YjfL (UPF0719 family)